MSKRPIINGKIDVRVPGKTILHGEHAVVYGKAAFAVSINLMTDVQLELRDDNKLVLCLSRLEFVEEYDLKAFKNFPLCHSDDDIPSASVFQNNEQVCNFISSSCVTESQKLSVTAFLYLWLNICSSSGSGTLACSVTIGSELGIGSGMGSSASYSVGVATAVLIACGLISENISKEESDTINKWAFEAEKIFHGTPSGIDNAVCIYGGAVYFEKGAVQKMMSCLPGCIKGFIVDTKVPRSTRAQVDNLRKKKAKYPNVVDPIIEAIGELTKESWQLFQNFLGHAQESDSSVFQSFQELVLTNHHLLNALGVGHPELDRVVQISEKYGCSAKLSGAGGGGCAIVILSDEAGHSPTKAAKLKNELMECNFTVNDIVFGANPLCAKICR